MLCCLEGKPGTHIPPAPGLPATSFTYNCTSRPAPRTLLTSPRHTLHSHPPPNPPAPPSARPLCPAPTLRAATRSGDPAMPIEKVCSLWSLSKALGESLMCRTATLATRLESSPPDSRMASGASDISRFTTALMKVCCGAEGGEGPSERAAHEHGRRSVAEDVRGAGKEIKRNGGRLVAC
jgi:hypothetical protein